MPALNTPIPMRHRPEEMVPRGLVIAMFALMLGALALVGFARLAGLPPVGVVAPSAIVAERSLFISGDRGGPYALREADGTLVAASTDARAGFIGIVGLVVNRERMTLGVTGSPPIRVVRRDSGTIAVIDDATGLTLDLIGYGADNVAAFARLLD